MFNSQFRRGSASRRGVADIVEETGMMELIQFAWSPYCIVQRRILQFSGVRFKITEIPPGDRSLVWRLTRGRYYKVPVLKASRSIVFEEGDDSQVIAKYLDLELQLGLFPREWEGVQSILWPHIENTVEGVAFKLNDSYWETFVSKADSLSYLRYKERKFGSGCLDLWARQRGRLQTELEALLLPFDQMLTSHPFLLDERPRFVDFDLFGILGNYLFSGHTTLPRRHHRIRRWYETMDRIKRKDVCS